MMMNMVSTVDGITEIDGVCLDLWEALETRIFLELFGHFRTSLWWEAPPPCLSNTTPTSTSVSTKARRLANGAWPVARIAVVSSQLTFDLTLPMFQRPSQRPLVITTVDAEPSKISQVAEHADLIRCGSGSVDLPQAMRELSELGAQRVLSEGGPSLNGALLRDDLVDEVFLSVAPLMGGGSQRGIARGEIPNIHELELRHVLTEDHFLFLRYTRATATLPLGS